MKLLVNFKGMYKGQLGFPGGSAVKNPPEVQEIQV